MRVTNIVLRIVRVRAGEAILAVLLANLFSSAEAQTQPLAVSAQHTFFHVLLDRSFSKPAFGRLLLFVASPSGDGSQVDINMMSPGSVYVAAKEVGSLSPGESVDIDADDLSRGVTECKPYSICITVTTTIAALPAICSPRRF